ncbi:SDR family NAD(P)-dependent oxidoreductase [Nocardioides agariphilus]|uniref:SDR family NAD(P)-dependent oxidoreductase n=1 Tax=Nocardioides agariphilus TaxID=433664 RepID=A0A930YN65_9ACTN|nr:SDR family NAD(P)-dependent oxidoreductase [Nocardioides agariphilus]MBF4768854.1 SDR family NAD(P)-dependent oxidoreductase [Nocardioides agariphilus]
MSENKTLTDTVALVSGASRGLGRAVARELAAAGAQVIATGRSRRGSATQTAVDDLTLDRTVEMIEEAGGSAEAVTCDHTDPAAVRRLVDDVLARHGRIDVLVNNAWGGHDHHDEASEDPASEDPSGEEVWDEPMTQFRDMLLAGAYSDFVTDMTVLKHAMGPAGRGTIITTTWHTPEPPAWVPYESSKAAKNRLVYALGHHLRDKGIACVAVAPGWMRTELMEVHHDPRELDGRTETPHYAARAVVALAADPDAIRFTGRTMDVAVLARDYGFTDLDGTQPDLNAGRF